MRSTLSWGIGDLHDLADLARWSGRDLGAGFVLINPLHAASPVPPMAPSPYLPVTRRFANPMYLRIEDVPEYARLAPAVAGRIEELATQLRRLDSTADLLDRDAVWVAKRTALEAIHQAGRDAEREAAYASFREAEGAGLVDFATWCAISDVHGAMAEWPDRPRASRYPGRCRLPRGERGPRRLPHVDAVARRRADGGHPGRRP